MEVLEAAWTGGIRYFDTAPRYGQGRAERHLGDFLRGRAGYVLSSKVGRVLRPGGGDVMSFHEVIDYSRDGILRSHEHSLARLGVDRIDVLYVHDLGRMQHGEAHEAQMRSLLGGGLAALEELKASGAVAAIGIGVNEVEVCLELLPRVNMDVILLAGHYTLLDRSAEARLLPALAGRDTRLVIGGLVNSGVLLQDGPQLFDYRPASNDVVVRARCIAKMVAQSGHVVTDLATNFPLAHPSVASVLIGTTEVARGIWTGALSG